MDGIGSIAIRWFSWEPSTNPWAHHNRFSKRRHWPPTNHPWRQGNPRRVGGLGVVLFG